MKANAGLGYATERRTISAEGVLDERHRAAGGGEDERRDDEREDERRADADDETAGAAG
jgi:hypothetical protein